MPVLEAVERTAVECFAESVMVFDQFVVVVLDESQSLLASIRMRR